MRISNAGTSAKLLYLLTASHIAHGKLFLQFFPTYFNGADGGFLKGWNTPLKNLNNLINKKFRKINFGINLFNNISRTFGGFLPLV